MPREDEFKHPGNGGVYGGGIGYPLGQGVPGGTSPVREMTSREKADEEEKMAETCRSILNDFLVRPTAETTKRLDAALTKYTTLWSDGRVRVL